MRNYVSQRVVVAFQQPCLQYLQIQRVNFSSLAALDGHVTLVGHLADKVCGSYLQLRAEKPRA